jgi:enoyl-CoA hydratase/carnithine racemase
LILNQTITAEQAVAWGLASRVVPAEGLFDLALKTAQDIALKQPGSIARTKTLLRADLPKVRDGLQAEKSQFVEQIASEEARRAMQVFLKIEDRG